MEHEHYCPHYHHHWCGRSTSGKSYTQEELTRAAGDLLGVFAVAGLRKEEFIEGLLLQVRKNRVYDGS